LPEEKDLIDKEIIEETELEYLSNLEEINDVYDWF